MELESEYRKAQKEIYQLKRTVLASLGMLLFMVVFLNILIYFYVPADTKIHAPNETPTPVAIKTVPAN